VNVVDLFPPPADEVREGLYSVIAGALAGGAPEPSWIAVDDGTGSWVVEVSTRSAEERVRGVVAASSEDALVKAQLLGVGGAMWLPPSSLGALEAYSTAASTEAPVALDAASLELLEGRTPIQVVSIVDRRFWRTQVGDRALENLTTELAVALEAPAAILRWPALVVADCGPEEIVTAWEELASKREKIGPSVSVLSLEPEALESGLLEGAYAALAGGSSAAQSPGLVPPQPVHELPHGRRVGWWLIRNDQEPEEEGWVATPVEAGAARCRWQLEGSESSETVVEVLGSEEVEGVGEAVAVRVPGWASRRLRPGSPAGLLVTRIAEATSRRGLPLWIPGVDQEGLRLVLGLPGTIWVDGPAVPH
jgi:hypothetical protein